jgi:hypothetical protein
MEPESLFLFAQESYTGHDPEPDPYHLMLYPRSISISYTDLSLGLAIVSSLLAFSTISSSMRPSTLPFVLYHAHYFVLDFAGRRYHITLNGMQVFSVVFFGLVFAKY